MVQKKQLPSHIEGKKWLTRQDVANYLQVSLRTADKLIHNKNFVGLVYFGRAVRISKAALDEYLKNHTEYRL